MLDPLEPSAVLGGEVDPTSAAKKKKKGSKKSRKKQMKEGSHCDAVLSLSWNPVYRQLLARHTHTHTPYTMPYMHRIPLTFPTQLLPYSLSRPAGRPTAL